MSLARFISKARNCPTIVTTYDNACFGCTKKPTQIQKKVENYTPHKQHTSKK
jgi:hypothetical protein